MSDTEGFEELPDEDGDYCEECGAFVPGDHSAYGGFCLCPDCMGS